jgi:rod shape-determining protein MreD
MARSSPPFRLMTADERRGWWLGHWRAGVPALFTLLMTLLMLAPLPTPVPLFPHLALLSVFCWAMVRPRLLPVPVAFALGALADLLFGMPVGVAATLFALVAVVVRLADRLLGDHALWLDWLLLALVLLGFEAGSVGLMAVAGQPVPFWPQLWQWLTTLMAYPLVVWLVVRVQRRWLPDQG